ncbi:hypothetical protein ACOMHN_032833 [Nucella lapillus]
MRNNMASESLTASCSYGRTFCLVLVCVACFHSAIGYAPLLYVTCRGHIDLKGTAPEVSDNQYDAGLLQTQLPLIIRPFVKEEDRCDITLGIPGNYGLMFYFIWLDFQDGEDPVKCSTASLQFFDGTPNQFVTGMYKPICGQMAQMPREKYFVKNSLLLIRIEAKNKILGRGFQIHFNVFRNDPPCQYEEFLCDTQGPPRCIADHLVCDGWNDCGDELDEDQEYRCNYLLDGAIAVLIVGIFLFIGFVVFVILWCRRQKGRYWVTREIKNMVEIRPSSLSNSREALEASFTVTSENLENEKYGDLHRSNNSRQSGRRSRPQTPTRYEHDDEESPPPYGEKALMYRDPHVSHSEDPEEAGRPCRGSRRRSRTRDSEEGVEEGGGGGGAVKGRRRRSRSREDRFSSREEKEDERRREGRYPDDQDERNIHPRHPSRSDDRDSPRADRRSYDRNNDSYDDRRHKPYDKRYPDEKRRQPDDRYPQESRRDRYDDRYPDESRRQPDYDDRSPDERRHRPYNDRYRYQDERDSDSRHSRQSDSYPSRYDDRDRDRRDRDRDTYSTRRDRENDRDRDSERDTDTDRERERGTDRDEDRDRRSRGERPRSRREDPEDRRPEKDPRVDHLHYQRDQRRSPHVSDSDLDSPKDDRRRASPRDRSRDEERDSSSREDPYRAPYNSRPVSSGDRPSERSRRQDDSHPPQSRTANPPPSHSPSDQPSATDSRPHSRHVTPSDSQPPPDDNGSDTPSRRRRRRRDRAASGDGPISSPPAAEQPPEGDDTPRRHRRRSRSRERQERARASHPGEGGEEEGGVGRRERQSRPSGVPVEGGGYKEESV